MKLLLSPGPWRAETGELGTIVFDAQQNPVCWFGRNDYTTTVNADGNATFIVRACNAHDELLAVLEAIEDHIKRGAPGPEGHALRRRLQAAIAMAKGGAA